MERDFWISELQTHLKKRDDLCDKLRTMGVRVYLFGSAVRSSSPNDIDLVFLYCSTTQLSDLIRLRNAIINYVHAEYKMSIDQVTISEDEDKHIGFLASEGAELICI